MNTKVVQSDYSGYVCITAADWETRLHQFLANPGLRQQLGAAARVTVVAHYLVQAN